MNEIKKILAINFGGIGDEILFLPTLISLKKAYPDAKITLALEPRSKGIKDLTDVIDDLFLIDIKFKNKYLQLLKLIFLSRKGKFDLVISSGANKFISILLFLTGIKQRYGYNTGKLSQKLLTVAVPLNKNQYAASMYHDLISDITDIKTKLPEINVEKVQKEPNTVLIHPGVSKLSTKLGMIKTISPVKWAKVIDLLLEKGKKVILAGGPDDRECIAQIKSTINNFENSNFIDAYGQTKNLSDLAKLIASSEKFLCSDSAPLHIAVALKTRTYVIFGPTDDKILIPQTPVINAIKADDNCELKPCLWQKRQTTCQELSCLDILPEDIVHKVLLD
ncbi:MAG TPA: glycosyltransferase family 9 protein [Candidatus Gastranaerophilaceae bacterium]|nr:glycosyltransferase family 9 protein [Candidatus Gastranaerophilaceae bacterium]HPT41492.1 glycosyltransferase family 9 protein [Candidatus Gastranaerophilaceae bacterium]